MVIRESQLTKFEEVAQDRFIDEMIDRVEQEAPRLAAVAGKSGVRQFVIESVAEARHFGFTSREPIRFFLETAVLLGQDFARDPQYPWAAKVLNGQEPEDFRADLLSRYLFDYLDDVVGPGGEIAQRALQRLAQVLPPSLPAARLPEGDEALKWMRQCYPEKFDYVGASQIRMLFGRAAETAAGFGLHQAPGTSLLGLLMIAFGHGVTRNPLYPWIGESLTDPALTDPQARLERLYDRARTYLQYVLTHLKEA